MRVLMRCHSTRAPETLCRLRCRLGSRLARGGGRLQGLVAARVALAQLGLHRAPLLHGAAKARRLAEHPARGRAARAQTEGRRPPGLSIPCLGGCCAQSAALFARGQ